MNGKKEASRLSTEYLDSLIRIADKYEIDRERFVQICLLSLVNTASTINYSKYRSEKGE